MKKEVGRPSKYTQELADVICERMIDGKSLRSIARANDMPAASTIFRWLREQPKFREQYARACEERSEAMAEDIIEIADDGKNDTYTIQKGEHEVTVVDTDVIQRSKLRVETRKWLMAKMKPKKYGDKLDLTSDGKQLPTPIMGGTSVSADNNISEDSKS